MNNNPDPLAPSPDPTPNPNSMPEPTPDSAPNPPLPNQPTADPNMSAAPTMPPTTPDPAQPFPSQSQPPMPNQPIQQTPPMPGQNPQMPYQQPAAPNFQAAPAPNKPKDNHKMILIIAGIVAAVVVAGIIAATIIVLNSNNNKNNSSKNDYESSADANTASSTTTDTTSFGGFTFNHVSGYKYTAEASRLVVSNSQTAYMFSTPTRASITDAKSQSASLKAELEAGGYTVNGVLEQTVDSTPMVIFQVAQGQKELFYVIAQSTNSKYVFQAMAANRNYTADMSILNDLAKIIQNAQYGTGGSSYAEPTDSAESTEAQTITVSPDLEGATNAQFE